MYVIVNATTISTYFGAQLESPLNNQLFTLLSDMLPSRVFYLAKNVDKLVIAAYSPLPHLMDLWLVKSNTQTNKTMQPDFCLFSTFSREILDFCKAHRFFSSSGYLVRCHTSGEGKKVLVLQTFSPPLVRLFFQNAETNFLESQSGKAILIQKSLIVKFSFCICAHICVWEG